MADLILTTKDELIEIVQKAVSQAMSQFEKDKTINRHSKY